MGKEDRATEINIETEILKKQNRKYIEAKNKNKRQTKPQQMVKTKSNKQKHK